MISIYKIRPDEVSDLRSMYYREEQYEMTLSEGLILIWRKYTESNPHTLVGVFPTRSFYMLQTPN